MSISPTRRLTAVLPELVRSARLRRQLTIEQHALTGARMGGIYAWGIEQGRFCGEVFGPDKAAACGQASFLAPQVPAVPGIRILRQLPSDDVGVASFAAADASGEEVRVLLRLPGDNDKLIADTWLIGQLARLLPAHGHYISRPDLVQLVEDVARMAAIDHDLAAEAAGIEAASAVGRFTVPTVVHQTADVLVVTGIAGSPVGDLPAAQRVAAYRAAVTHWSRMLLADGILGTTLRRDRLRADGDRLEVTRWAGTKQAGSATAAFLRSLLLASFHPAAGREDARAQASRFLLEGFGMDGPLDSIESFCLSLISENHPLKVSRQMFSGIGERTVQQNGRYRQEQRIELFQLLRQLIWLRDIGFSCQVPDLTAPWRELATEITGS